MKVVMNGWIDRASGSHGDLVFSERNGETIVGRKPQKKKPDSEKQVEVHKQFRRAADYANYVKVNPALLPLYEAAAQRTGKSVDQMCRQDWYRAPEIDDIRLEKYKGQVGETIRVIVYDVIGVETVLMTLYDDEAGTLIEQGDAVLEFEGAGHWIYTATKQVPAGITVAIRAEAYDYPGNVTRQAGSKQIPAL